MRIAFDRKSLVTAFGTASGFAAIKSPLDVLRQVKLVASESGAVLMATDNVQGAVVDVLGAEVAEPGEAILPTADIKAILGASADDKLDIEGTPGQVAIRGLFSEFEFQTEDPATFPAIPPFPESGYHVIAAGELKRAIARTVYATDAVSRRYALGGCLLDFDGLSLTMVATDERRLVTQSATLERAGEVAQGNPIVPEKALRLIERHLADADPPVRVMATGSDFMVKTASATIRTSIITGRFPAYGHAFPAGESAVVPIKAADLASAIRQAAVMVDEDVTGSRAVEIRFSKGLLTVSSQRGERGRSKVQIPVEYDGEGAVVSVYARFVVESLKALGESIVSVVLGELERTSDGVEYRRFVLRTDDGFRGVVFPITR